MSKDDLIDCWGSIRESDTAFVYIYTDSEGHETEIDGMVMKDFVRTEFDKMVLKVFHKMAD